MNFSPLPLLPLAAVAPKAGAPNITVTTTACTHYLPLLELPVLLPLDPLVDVARDPVVDVPVEPITGVLGATGALLGAVLPVAVLGGLAPPNGTTPGIAVGPDG